MNLDTATHAELIAEIKRLAKENYELASRNVRLAEAIKDLRTGARQRSQSHQDVIAKCNDALAVDAPPEAAGSARGDGRAATRRGRIVH